MGCSAGGWGASAGQIEIVRVMIDGGLTAKEAAAHLGCRPCTVKKQIERLYHKLGITNHAGLTRCLITELMRMVPEAANRG